jgi:hypothetical protein
MPRERKKPWFCVKSHGYGVGLPVAWEGWLVLFLYLGTIVATAAMVSELASLIVAVLLAPLIVYISYARSDGEWRWRNGA